MEDFLPQYHYLQLYSEPKTTYSKNNDAAAGPESWATVWLSILRFVPSHFWMQKECAAWATSGICWWKVCHKGESEHLKSQQATSSETSRPLSTNTLESFGLTLCWRSESGDITWMKSSGYVLIKMRWCDDMLHSGIWGRVASRLTLNQAYLFVIYSCIIERSHNRYSIK